MKKISAILLSVAMLITMMPAVAFAEEPLVKKEQSIIYNPVETTIYLKTTSTKSVLSVPVLENAELTGANVGTASVAVSNKKILKVSEKEIIEQNDREFYQWTITGKKTGTATLTLSFSGDENYAAASQPIKFKVAKARKLTGSNVKLDKTAYTYDGDSHIPDVSVIWKKNEVDDEFYTVTEPEEAVDAGTYTIRVEGQNNKYYGTVKKTYKINKAAQTIEAKINKKKLSAYGSETAMVEFVKSSIGAKEAVFTSSNDKMLRVTPANDGKTAMVEAVGNKSGKADVIVTVKGNKNYKKAVKKFTVKVKGAADLSKATITLAKTEYTYSGKANKPAVSVTLNGKTVPTSSYNVKYTNNTNAGTATVTITANSKKYKGTNQTTFEIVKAEQKLIATPNSDLQDFVIPSTRKVHDVFELRVQSVRADTDIATKVDHSMFTFEYKDPNSLLRKTGDLKELKVNPYIFFKNGLAICEFEVVAHTILGGGTGIIEFTVTSPETRNYNAATTTIEYIVQ